MCKPSDTASETTGMSASVGDFSGDEDHLSIAVDPLESLEATACTPPSVAAETAPSEELDEPVSYQKTSSQTSRDGSPR